MSAMETLPSLDALAHIAASRTAAELVDAGTVLAMTGSPDEAVLVIDRREPYIVWGVGCHPRDLKAQEAFNADLFRELVERTAIVGEIGLDGRSRRVPFETQLRTFRRALEALSIARHSKFRTAVPPERLLIETGHHRGSLPAAIPCRVEWVEYTLAEPKALGLGVKDVRRLVWQNFGAIIDKTGTWRLLPKQLAAIVAEIGPGVGHA